MLEPFKYLVDVIHWFRTTLVAFAYSMHAAALVAARSSFYSSRSVL